MRIGLASDSHGHVDALAAALAHFRAAGVDRILFLGARWADVDAAVDRFEVPAGASPAAAGTFRGVLADHAVGPDAERERLRRRIVRVASRTCPEAAGGAAPRKLIELVEGHVACLVHDKSELTRDDISNAALLFHGNGARAAIVRIGPRVFATPGPLRAPADGGGPATWAIAEVEPRALTLVVHGLDGRELRRERAELGGRAKMVVR